MLVVDNAILGVSYNGAPEGQPHCTDVGCLIDEPNYGPHCIRCSHAEMNVLLGAAAQGVQTKGGLLVVTHQPCTLCSTMIGRAKIQRVLFSKYYGSIDNIKLLQSMGVEVSRRTFYEQKSDNS